MLVGKGNKKKGFSLRIKDDQGLIGGILVFALMVAMLAATLLFCYYITTDMADSVETLLKGEKDVEILGIDDSSGVPIPNTNHLTQKTFNWCAGIMMSFMGLAILGIAFTYFTGIFSPEAAVKAKAMGMKLILAIALAPFIWIPLYYVIKINQVMCTSFIGMSGYDISSKWCSTFAAEWGALTLVPMFAMAIAGLAVTFYSILLFRLVFIMITYAIAPLAIVLCVFPQTREFGMKLLKIFFEAVFCLLFLNMGLIFCFEIFGSIGLNNPMGFVFAVCGLAFPIALFKILFNPISGAIGGAASAGVGAIAGVVGGGMGIGGAARGLSMGGGKGGAGAGAAGAAGGGTGGVTDKVAEAGTGMAQTDPHGFGAPIGLAVAGGALAFKGGKKGIQAMAKKYGEYKQDKKALGGAFGVVDAKKPGAPGYMLGEKHKTIGGMRREAEKQGMGEVFDKMHDEQKAGWVVQHGEEKKQHTFMNNTGRTAEDYHLLQKNPASLNKSEQRRQEQIQTDLKYGGMGARLQKKYGEIDKSVTKKLGKLGVAPSDKNRIQMGGLGGKTSVNYTQGRDSIAQRRELLNTAGLDKTSKEYQSKNLLRNAMGRDFHAYGGDDKAYARVGKEYGSYLDALKNKDYNKVYGMMQQDKRIKMPKGGEK